MNVFDKNILIIGLGASGVAAYKLLKERGAKKIFTYDDDAKLSIDGETNYKSVSGFDWMDNLNLVVVSPSVENSHKLVVEAIKRKIKIVSEMALGFSCLKCKTIAVTGTNGKTTTVGMIKSLLVACGKKARAVGNIGYPVSQLVLDNDDTEIAVVEVSSFQLEHGDVVADVAVILNFSPDHMDRYERYDDYVNTKLRLLTAQKDTSVAILNGDDKKLMSAVNLVKGTYKLFSVTAKDGDAYVKDGYLFYGGESITPIKGVRVRGEHNRSNLLCALTVAKLFNVPAGAVTSFVRKYKLPPHRVEFVATVSGKKFYNDSKGTNILATETAVKMLDGDLGLILGGSDKKEDFSVLFDSLPERVKKVAVTGDNAERIVDHARKVGFSQISTYASLKEAVNALFEDMTIESILFSPASASFDRYKNYEERGNAFKQIVFGLGKA